MEVACGYLEYERVSAAQPVRDNLNRMPAIAEHKLSKEEFHARYDGEKPYYEYWDGEAVQKAMPTWVHGLIQRILQRLLLATLDTITGSEVELHLDPSLRARSGCHSGGGAGDRPYPTKAIRGCRSRFFRRNDPILTRSRKCRLYEKWGIRQIVVIDPESRVIWRFENGMPVETEVIATRGEAKILGGRPLGRSGPAVKP